MPNAAPKPPRVSPGASVHGQVGRLLYNQSPKGGLIEGVEVALAEVSGGGGLAPLVAIKKGHAQPPEIGIGGARLWAIQIRWQGQGTAFGIAR